jgi:hypothetical protein
MAVWPLLTRARGLQGADARLVFVPAGYRGLLGPDGRMVAPDAKGRMHNKYCRVACRAAATAPQTRTALIEIQSPLFAECANLANVWSADIERLVLNGSELPGQSAEPSSLARRATRAALRARLASCVARVAAEELAQCTNKLIRRGTGFIQRRTSGAEVYHWRPHLVGTAKRRRTEDAEDEFDGPVATAHF